MNDHIGLCILTDSTSATATQLPAASSHSPTGATQPTTGATQLTTGATQPTTGATQPATGATQPTTGATQPTTGATQPTTRATQPTTPAGATQSPTATVQSTTEAAESTGASPSITTTIQAPLESTEASQTPAKTSGQQGETTQSQTGPTQQRSIAFTTPKMTAGVSLTSGTNTKMTTTQVVLAATTELPACGTPETCLSCICGAYSNDGSPGCGVVTGDGGTCETGCKSIGTSCHCGAYGITSQMFDVCKSGSLKLPQTKFKKCHSAVKCSTKCVMNYISENGATCVGKTDIATMTCDEQARIYKGGAAGCNGVEAQQFADTVRQCCGKI